MSEVPNLKRKREDSDDKEVSPPTKRQKKAKTVTVPIHSDWFNLSDINDLERTSLPEFFSEGNDSKSAETYKGIRDFIVTKFRQHPLKYLSSAVCRSIISGDVCSIIRIHSFLEQWGIINYGLNPQKERTNTSKVVIDNYLNNRTTQPIKTDTVVVKWSQEEYLRLFDGIEKFGEDWTKVSEYVGTKTREDCVKTFLKLPIQEKYLRNIGCGEKRVVQEPVPFADMSNPVIATATYLAATCNSKALDVAAKAIQGVQDGEEEVVVDPQFDVSQMDVKMSSTLALAAAKVRARVIAEQEEFEIQKILNEIVLKQSQKVDLKLSEMKKLEAIYKKDK